MNTSPTLDDLLTHLAPTEMASLWYVLDTAAENAQVDESVAILVNAADTVWDTLRVDNGAREARRLVIEACQAAGARR